MMWALFSWTRCLLFLALFSLASPSVAQEETPPPRPDAVEIEDETYLHAVEIEGDELFKLRGSSALPANERAQAVAERIIQVAAERGDNKAVMAIQQGEFGLGIYADGMLITDTTKADADYERFEIDVLAQLHLAAVETAINTYRDSRSNKALTTSALTAGLWTLVFAAYCGALMMGRRLLPTTVASFVKTRTKGVGEATGDVLRSDAIAHMTQFLSRMVLDLFLLIGFYYYLSFVLFSFPQTKPFAQLLIRYVTDPVLAILQNFTSYLPNLITIAVLAMLARLLIKTVRLFFENLEAGVITWKNFETHWIWPTYNLIQLAIILMTMVICFPYIPGADSAAFKGLTIFMGLVLSLGSNTVVANALAGIFVLYKRSMTVGDRIRVGDHYGDVMQIKLMETYIKSVKNELISIPNSTLISSEVMNYSTKIDGRGLLLHTTVGIGYEEPRDKIEAMLVEASRRTDGLKNSPPPFVLMDKLGDFGINYQVNAYTTRGSSLPRLLSELHKNIVDVFNENDVAIMTPAYETDTDIPKVAPVIWEGNLAPNARELAKNSAKADKA